MRDWLIGYGLAMLPAALWILAGWLTERSREQ
jgi:hypothetical protein